MNKSNYYTISELAADLDISASAIRFYEEKGLIKPERTAGNQRIYTKKNRARLKLILRGKRFGATLDQIAEMIGTAEAEKDEIDQIQRSLYYIENRFIEIEEHRKELALFEEDLRHLKKNLLERKRKLEGTE